MKLRIIILIVLFGLLISARPLVAQQEGGVERTAQRCLLAQSYLKGIQKPRDLRARVDRLQGYRYIASRMETFVRRLERNNQPMAKELRASLQSLEAETDTFKNSYESYDKAREDLTKVQDCTNNTAEFQAKLEIARQKRGEVNVSVNSIQNLLSTTTKSQLTELYNELLATSKTAGDTND